VAAAPSFLFVAACGLVIALCGMVSPIHGSGAGSDERGHQRRPSAAVAFLPMKWLGMLATFLTGCRAASSPVAVDGRGLGSWFAPFFAPELTVKLMAIGMAAMLAAVTRAPLTAAVIMIEMTDGHAMVISILATSLVAASVARIYRTHFYEVLAENAARVVRPHAG
jgi:H+/Cl- antiporter ClcA